MSGARRLWEDFSTGRIDHYGARRDFPAVKGVSYLSVHLRFGTISVRELVSAAIERRADTWLSELIWRDFYFMILDHFPQVAGHAFKPEYDTIQWAHWPEGYSPPGAPGAPATRWSMPRCAS